MVKSEECFEIDECLIEMWRNFAIKAVVLIACLQNSKVGLTFEVIALHTFATALAVFHDISKNKTFIDDLQILLVYELGLTDVENDRPVT